MSDDFTGFRKQGTQFLARLKRNNEREWFEKNRETYESELRVPLAALVEEVDVRLASFIPEIVGDPKRSLFRIHRDVRFSSDKSPYKTHVAAWFHHSDAGHGVGSAAAHGGAGFYFHLEAGRASLGGGIWMPPRPALNRIRDAIADDQRPLARILGNSAVRKQFGSLAEENMLTRMPRGFSGSHPAATLLRHQSFTLGRELTPAEIFSSSLPDVLGREYERLVPLVRWINTTLGLRTLGKR